MALVGNLRVASDKSITHRAIILSSMAVGGTTIYRPLLCEDTMATVDMCRALGVKITIDADEEVMVVESPGHAGFTAPEGVLWAGNSGTTARLMMGVLATMPFDSVIDGDESLRRRPMGRVAGPLGSMGAKIELSEEGGLPAKIKGVKWIKAITFDMSVASAQVKSAIMLASLRAIVYPDLIIREFGYSRNHTERMLREFGISVGLNSEGITIISGQALESPGEIHVPADISSAAFFMVAALLIPGSDIVLTQVGANPTRRGILSVAYSMGADIEILDEGVVSGEPFCDIRVKYTSEFIPATIDEKLVPKLIDEIPILALLMARADGVSVIRDAAELRVKESDRIKTTVNLLNNFEVDIYENIDGLTIYGSRWRLFYPANKEVDPQGDHRMAMLLHVVSLLTNEEFQIKNPDCINVSYPNFFQDFDNLKEKPGRINSPKSYRTYLYVDEYEYEADEFLYELYDIKNEF